MQKVRARKRGILLLIMLTLMLTACGQKGELYLPDGLLALDRIG